MIDTAEAKLLLPDYLEAQFGITNLNRSLRCPNPEHKDSSPSAHYYATPTPHVHCFACGKSWDVFALAGMVIGDDSFNAQRDEIERTLGTSLTTGTQVPRKRKPTKPTIPAPAALDFSGDVFETCMQANKALYSDPRAAKARAYLYGRGFDDAVINWNYLGWCQHPSEIMSQAKTAPQSANGWIVIPFPATDLLQAVFYCVFRRLTEPGSKGMKEYKPSGLTQPLWNEHLLTSSCRSAVFVSEGIFDALSLQLLAQTTNTVALMGTGGANRLVQVMAHSAKETWPKKLVLVLDGDEAGRKAAAKAEHDLRGIGVPVVNANPFGEGDANDRLIAMHKGVA